MDVDKSAEQPVVGPKEGTPTPEAQTAPPAAAAPPNPDLEAYNQKWTTVQNDPQDFNTFTALLGIADRLEDAEKMRAAYDAFLAEYPLCYGYWKKYADAELRHGSAEAAAAVYERGVVATPYSADLWAHYAAFKKGLPEATPDDVRGVYERGLAYVCTDFNSHGLWDKYLAFEGEQASTLHVSSLYCRLLACPVRELDRYYNSFKTYVGPLAAAQVILPHDFDSIRVRLEAEAAAKAAEVEAAAKAQAAEAAAKAAEAAEVKKEEEAAEGAEVKMEDAAAEGDAAAAAAAAAAAEGAEVKKEEGGEGAAPPPPPANGEVKAEEEAKGPAAVTDDDIKQAWMKQQEAVYEATRAELAKRRPFEEAARRPYFHVKPLDGVQLFNWIKYLDHMEARGEPTATQTVYERCLVACANYPEFWQRYVRYLEARGDEAGAKAALDRGVLVFCKRRPEMHMFAAHWDELHGDVAGARARYVHLLTHVSPRLIEAVTSAANFERRQGDLPAAVKYLRDLTEEERSKEGSRIYPFLAIHLAHFLRRHSGDLAEARKVLDEALEQCPGVRSLWEAAVHFEELAGGPEAVARALDLYDRATAPPAEGTTAAVAGKSLPERDREELSARSVDFADMYGSAAQLKAACDRHAARFMLPTTVTAEARAATSGGKRGHEGGAAGAAKAPRLDHGHHHAPPPPPMAAAQPAAAAHHAMAAGHHAAAYGAYGQAPAAAAASAAAYSQYYGQYGAAQQYPAYGYGYSGYGY
ncbi:hypothetical protein HXX76_007074 [Chlamydomonas incerta]|uniref:Suppressor of forked domain-containing protein n=1 Tax=Chlamydomonas incerta TaxID=51695 RepID=A0A835SZ52_CHLIN|nr:hypothetical protein HXX76_007074 [Chlamydomonas incerta]|eukprot:KAG2435879.1 hypothetical protein HXX76_007074 [Chlamydomonas incerta]